MASYVVTSAFFSFNVCAFASVRFTPVLQVEHTRDIMSEVEAVSGQYEALAVSCSQLYFALATLRDVHFLYHFSLRFFQGILAHVRGRACPVLQWSAVLLRFCLGAETCF